MGDQPHFHSFLEASHKESSKLKRTKSKSHKIIKKYPKVNSHWYVSIFWVVFIILDFDSHHLLYHIMYFDDSYTKKL